MLQVPSRRASKKPRLKRVIDAKKKRKLLSASQQREIECFWGEVLFELVVGSPLLLPRLCCIAKGFPICGSIGGGLFVYPPTLYCAAVVLVQKTTARRPKQRVELIQANLI